MAPRLEATSTRLRSARSAFLVVGPLVLIFASLWIKTDLEALRSIRSRGGTPSDTLTFDGRKPKSLSLFGNFPVFDLAVGDAAKDENENKKNVESVPIVPTEEPTAAPTVPTKFPTRKPTRSPTPPPTNLPTPRPFDFEGRDGDTVPETCPLNDLSKHGSYPDYTNGVWSWSHNPFMGIVKECWPHSYGNDAACILLEGYTVYIAGDSTSRRLAFTLKALLAGRWSGVSRPDAQVSRDQHLPDFKPGKKWMHNSHSNSDQFPSFFCGEGAGSVKIRYKEAPFVGEVERQIKLYMKSTKKSMRRYIYVFSIGSWHLTNRQFRTPEKLNVVMEKLNSVFRLIQDYRLAHPEDSTLWLWRTPTPVDETSARFSGKQSNNLLHEFSKFSMFSAREHGIAAVDVFEPISDPAAHMMWETGKEWKAEQKGSIHLLDEGRRTVSQFVLNALALSTRCAPCVSNNNNNE